MLESGFKEVIKFNPEAYWDVVVKQNAYEIKNYFKEEAIAWSLEFLTKHLHIPMERLAVTVFKGNNIVSADNESAEIWKKNGIKEERIAF